MTSEEKRQILELQKKIVALTDRCMSVCDYVSAEEVFRKLALQDDGGPKKDMLNREGAALFHLFRLAKIESATGVESSIRLFSSAQEARNVWCAYREFLRDMEFGIGNDLAERWSRLRESYPLSQTAILYMINLYGYHPESLCERCIPLLKGESPQTFSRPDYYKRPVYTLQKKTGVIAFILCTNDEKALYRCESYIASLEVPEGYEVTVCPVYEAKSMTQGYNEAMHFVEADYKIYLHQDALCINPYLLSELIPFFENHPEVGMVGVAGAPKMSDTGIWWATDHKFYNMVLDDVIRCDDCTIMDEGYYDETDWHSLSVMDGVFLATSCDVPWREDLFDGWHFYDASQCMEMRRAGKQLAVIRPHSGAWIVHEEATGNPLGGDYEGYREKFLEEYKDFI